MQSVASTATILGLDVSDYHAWADQVEIGFEKAAKFLHSQFVFTQQDVPVHYSINANSCPLCRIRGSPKVGQSQSPARTLVLVGYLSTVLTAASVETQYTLGLGQVARWIRGGPESRMVSEANFIPERLLSLRTRNSAAYKELDALQMKRGSAEWHTATPLLLNTWHDQKIDSHRIFPKTWCEKANPVIPKSLYNSVINKTPIDAATNRMIGGTAPLTLPVRFERQHQP